MRKVIILTEGGKGIGLGHITRCSALYEAFEEKGISPYLIVNADNSARELLKGKKNKIFNWLKKQAELLDLISGADAVIIDSYLAGNNFYKRVSSIAKLPIYMDDNKRLDYPRGVVVNGSIYAERLKYPPKKDNVYLLGIRYLPLRKEFCDAPHKKIKRSVKNILITVGGDDPKNIIPKMLKFLGDKYPRLNKAAIIGKSFKNIKEIERLRDDRTHLIYCPRANEVKKAMFRADIAVSAGGQTLYELARVGLPAIVMAMAKNQLNNIKGWREAGFIGYAGWYNDRKFISRLSKELDLFMVYQTRLKKSYSGRSRIDGRGANRIVDEIFNLVEDIKLRKAVEGDCLDILRWRNHPNVRRQSFGAGKISYSEHKKWFSGKLQDKKTSMYIAETEGLGKIGQIRFDILDGHLARVSVNLNPVFLGRGFGNKVIAKGTRFFLKERPAIKTVTAEILDENAVSKKAFQKAGYIFSHGILKDNKKSSVYKYED